MPKLVAVLAGVALAFPLWSQEKPKEVAPTQPTFFSETIEVRVINVDVVVTDKKGQPVTGLTRNDFDLYQNGQKQEITNFIELSGSPSSSPPPAQTAKTTTAPTQAGAPAAEPAPADTRLRRIVLFLDDAGTRPFNRNRILPAMKDFVARNVRGSDQVMIAVWNPGLEIRQPFTNDVAETQKTIDGLASKGALGMQMEVDRHRAEQQIRDLPTDYALRGELPPIDLGLAVCRAYAARALHEQREAAEAVKGVMSSMRGVEGRKALVLLTERLNDNPGRECFDYLEQHKDLFQGGGSASFQSEEAAYMDHDLVPAISKLANSTGMTIYPIDAAGLGGDSGISAENLGDEYNTPKRSAAFISVTHETMNQIASATGGSALTGSNNFKLAFDTVGNDLNSYYSLGFRTSGERKDVVSSLSVKLKSGKGYTVRTRMEFVEKSLTSEMNDAVAANLFFPIVRNDLNVKMTSGEGKAEADEHVTVPLEVKIPTEAFTLVPDGTDLTGHFALYVAFVRNDGMVSKVTRQETGLRFPADSLKRRKEITVRQTVTIDSRTEGVSIGVMDDYSHITGFAMLKLTPATVPAAAAASK